MRRIFLYAPVLCLSLMLDCSQHKRAMTEPFVAPPTKTFHVRMFLTGLTTLAAQVDRSLPPNSKIFLLPNFSATGHTAFFMADAPHAVETAGGWKKMDGTDADGHPVSHFFADLTGQEILLDRSTGWKSAPLNYRDMRPADTKCPQGDDISSLHWLPSLSDLAGRAVSLKPEFAASHPDASVLSGRMEILGGDLLPVLPSGQTVWEFKEDSVAASVVTSQVVADGVQLTFDVDLPAANPVWEVTGKAFAANSPLQMIVRLKPDSNGNISVMLANLNRSDTFTIRTPADKDVHFVHQYDVVTSVTNRPIPFRSTTQTCGAGGGDGVNCGPDRVP